MINILILNWNSSSEVDASINQILKSDYTNYRILLIDNFSRQEDIDNLKIIYEKYKNTCEIYLILNDKNYGYAGGNNKGYEYLVANNYDGNILILNPDIKITNNTLFELNAALCGNAGGVMCKTLNFDTSIMYDCIKLRGLSQKWLTTTKALVETDYLAGSCMLLNREVIDKTGLFDERFFLYWEEVDLSLRIKKYGYKILSTTNTHIYRENNSDERSIMSLYYLNRNIFLLKENNHIGNYDLIKYISNELMLTIYRTIRFKRKEYLLHYFKGLFDGIKGKYE